MLIIQGNRFGMQLSEKGHNNAKTNMTQNCNTIGSILSAVHYQWKGGRAEKVLESDWKTSITYCCIINGYIINIFTFWQLKLHSNRTSYDNIQIHVNKKNSRFTAKGVTKKSHCAVDVAFATTNLWIQ